ncbi:MAG TPA: phenylalanine--tRNA ligase subunit beta, partial [Chromatiales bacterium]|nr:phenylalanine--tRNA ligase subunit beta [Chromatiales bacterium]
GEPIVTALNLDDTIIDIDLTPNRADCFSVMGVARDLAAGLGAELTEPRTLPVLPVGNETFEVLLEDPEGCPRFAGRIIRDINPAAETPAWMQVRLQHCGVRPIHPVVDVTNYVMLELGQPMHGYDLDKLNGGIVVRRGYEEESLKLLDGQQVTVNPDVLVIADHRRAVGMAGIMGGAETAVGDHTRSVYLESAFFSPDVIAGRARRFGLHTDASVRFERGVDPQLQVRAIERATELLLEICGGRAEPIGEQVAEQHLPEPVAVTLRRERLAALLGADIPDEQVRDAFERLGMQVTSQDNGWTVTPPSARFDIAIEADLIEEVARIHGYDNIPEQTGQVRARLGQVSESLVPLQRARLTLVERGYQEAVTWSFTDPELDAMFAGGKPGLALANPISSALSVMRQSLWPGLVQVARHNLSRQQERVRLFETGIRFIPQGNDVKEDLLLSGLVIGTVWPEQWAEPGRTADLFDIKSDLEAVVALTGAVDEFSFEAAEHSALRPGRSGRLLRNDQPIGWFGELHPSLVQALELPAGPLLFEVQAAPLLAARLPQYRGVSRFPAVRRDLAVVVAEDLPVQRVLDVVRNAAGARLSDLRVFDVYLGEKVETGSKSVALGLILQDTSRTLTDADVDGVIQDVTDRLGREINATIRE